MAKLTSGWFGERTRHSNARKMSKKKNGVGKFFDLASSPVTKTAQVTEKAGKGLAKNTRKGGETFAALFLPKKRR